MRRFARTAVLGVLVLSSGALAAGGRIEGKVTYAGTAPAASELDRSSDPYCAKTHAKDETVLVGKKGALANVVIRLDGPSLPPATAPATPITVEQAACLYTPRVQVAQPGQGLVVRNTDETLHNVHAYAGKKGLFNVAQPPQSPPIQRPAPKDTDVVKLRCDVHPWMVGYVVYAKNRFSAVTKADGAFSLEGIPPGTYTLSAWQEKLGTVTQAVTVQEGKPTAVQLTFKAP